MLIMAMRRSGTFEASTVAGPHAYVAMAPSPAGAASEAGTVVFDASTWSATGTVNDSGASAPTSGAGTFAITVDGRMTMSMEGPYELDLGVREGGLASVGAAVTEGGAPRIVVALRR